MIMRLSRRIAAATVLLAALAACTLPRGAAMQREIFANAKDETPSFAHYDVNSALLASISHWPAAKGAGAPRQWISGGKGGSGQILQAGDAVRIAVWESGDNKLLTNPGAPAAQIEATRVSSAGSIFVPYVGQVKVAGLSPDAARAKVQEQVAQLIPEAQVQLDATPGKANSIDLVSGVAHPGNVPLIDRSLTVLGAISAGGGVAPSIENPQLRLQRAGRVYEISMRRVLDTPALDTGMQPGDKLIVEKDERRFLALGAAGKEQLVPFPKDDLTALEAVTLVGGINDARADPEGVLILREYPAAAVSADIGQGPSHSRVVFTMNLTTADGLFSAQNFAVQPNDLILATESPVNNTRTILGLIGAVAGAANSASAAADRLDD